MAIAARLAGDMSIKGGRPALALALIVSWTIALVAIAIVVSRYNLAGHLAL